ncbi:MULTISPECIES: HAD family hydrolase [Halomonadaceae]|uniref:HAD family hydrolase n=1 Tax=Halomonadaceae TaxID=28256 RepID=UPI00136BF807
MCDLDGTLLSVNSFRLWVLYWDVMGLFCPPFLAVWLIAQGRRLVGGSDRAVMKMELMRTYERFEGRLPMRLKSCFLWLLRMTINRRVQRMIEAYRGDGVPVLLATAAPCFYATPFGECLGVDGTVASYLEKGRMMEMVGDCKRVAVLHWLGADGGGRADWIMVALTDHQDDLPLALEADWTYLVNPSAESCRSFKSAGVAFKVLKSRG